LVALTELILALAATKTKTFPFIEYRLYMIEIRKRRRDGYLAAIHRDDLDIHALHKYRICSKHFVSGKPTSDNYDTTNPSWLPTLHLGHKGSKSEVVTRTAVERYERVRERDQR